MTEPIMRFKKSGEKLSKAIIKFMTSNNKGCKVLPLHSYKIHDIPCCVVIKITKEYLNNSKFGLSLEIKSEIGLLDEDQETPPHSLYFKWLINGGNSNEPIDGNKIYENIHSIISNLKISKLTGKFLDEDSFIDEEELVDFWNTITHSEIHKCCVCLDMCGGVDIICNHDICIDCISKLKPKKDEDDEDNECSNNIFCPLCRTRIGDFNGNSAIYLSC